VPVVAPERVTADLIAALKVAKGALFVSIHANHARELTAAAWRERTAALGVAGLPLAAEQPAAA
jgi:lysine 2,3-aminomutase